MSSDFFLFCFKCMSMGRGMGPWLDLFVALGVLCKYVEARSSVKCVLVSARLSLLLEVG